MLKKKYITLADLNKYAEEQNVDKEELRIFICKDISTLQKEDSKLPLYAEIDNSNDLRIIVKIDKDNVWNNFGYSRTILRNLTNEEKFNAICRSKNINKEIITSSIIDKIRQSNIEDKATFIGEHEIWDKEYITYELVDELYIDYCIEFKDELSINLSQKEKDFLKIANDLNINLISIKAMR